jgi:hypothetical protein
MSNPMFTRRRAGGILALVAIAAIVVACSADSGAAPVNIGSSVDQGAATAVPAARPAPDLVSLSGAGSGSGNGDVQFDVNTPDLQIIKTGTLNLQVTLLDDALASATQKITALGGYTSGSQQQGDGDQATATVTYRIPAARWDDAIVALRSLGTKVLGEQTQTEDVTGQIVDISARITNLQATETALQAIMLKATKIADVLAVQQQLTDVRGQIEQMTADRKHLTDQAAFSTLTVTYSLKEQAVAATTKRFDPSSEVDRASASLVDVFQSLATAGIWFAIVWLPILIGLAILALILVFILRRTALARPRRGSGPGAMGPDGPADAAGPGGGGGPELAPAPVAEA